MKAKLVNTQGPYLEASIEIDGKTYCLMDEITIDADSGPKEGEIFEIEFCNLLDEDESWEQIFSLFPY